MKNLTRSNEAIQAENWRGREVIKQLKYLAAVGVLARLVGTKRWRVAQPEQAMMGVPHLAQNKE